VFGGLVEQHDPGGGDHRTGQQQPPALTRRKRLGATDQHRRQAVTQTGEPVAQPDGVQCCDELVVSAVAPGDQQVVADGGREDVGVLGEKADGAAQVTFREAVDRDSVQQHLAVQRR